jgi:hypothetical protein
MIEASTSIMTASMSQRSFRLISAGIPYLSCTIIPMLVFGPLLGQWGTNLIWGHAFGFGWFLAQSYFGPEHWRIAASIGIFVWPPIVLAVLWALSGRVWRSGRRALRYGFLSLIAISALPIGPAQTIEQFYVERAGIPADFNILLNAY